MVWYGMVPYRGMLEMAARTETRAWTKKATVLNSIFKYLIASRKSNYPCVNIFCNTLSVHKKNGKCVLVVMLPTVPIICLL